MVAYTTLFLCLLPLLANKFQDVSSEPIFDVCPLEPGGLKPITFTSPDKRLQMIYHPSDSDLAVSENYDCTKCIDSMDAWSILHTKMLESYHASCKTLKSMYDTTSAASFRVFERVSATQHAMFQNVFEVIRQAANESAGAVESFGVYAYDKSMTATFHVRNATTRLREWFVERFSAELNNESED